MKDERKKFILGMTGYTLFLWLTRAIIAGAVQATAAFFAKNQWEKWKKGEKHEKNSSVVNSDIVDSDSNISEKA